MALSNRISFLFIPFFLLLLSCPCWSEDASLFQLSISMDKTEFVMGEPIDVTVELKNSSTESCHTSHFFNWMNGGLFLSFEVIGPDGNVLAYRGPWKSLLFEKLPEKTFQPHEKISKTLHLSLSYQFLDAGKYTIQAIYCHPKYILERNNKPNLITNTLKSNVIDIEIVDTNKVFDKRIGTDRYMGYEFGEKYIVYYQKFISMRSFEGTKLSMISGRHMASAEYMKSEYEKARRSFCNNEPLEIGKLNKEYPVGTDLFILFQEKKNLKSSWKRPIMLPVYDQPIDTDPSAIYREVVKKWRDKDFCGLEAYILNLNQKTSDDFYPSLILSSFLDYIYYGELSDLQLGKEKLKFVYDEVKNDQNKWGKFVGMLEYVITVFDNEMDITGELTSNPSEIRDLYGDRLPSHFFLLSLYPGVEP